MLKLVQDTDIGKGLTINQDSGYKVEVVASKDNGNTAEVRHDGIYVPLQSGGTVGNCNCTMEIYSGDLSDFRQVNMLDKQGLVHTVYKRFRELVPSTLQSISFDDISERPITESEYNDTSTSNISYSSTWAPFENTVITNGDLNIVLTVDNAHTSKLANITSVNDLSIYNLIRYEYLIGHDNAVINTTDNGNGTSRVSIIIPNVTYILQKQGEYSALYADAMLGRLSNTANKQVANIQFAAVDGVTPYIKVTSSSSITATLA